MKQAIGAPKSMTTLFFNPNSFSIIDILPENATFNAAYFIDRILETTCSASCKCDRG
jgi:hypothetical protein